jgi:hypothetical protein
VLAPRASRRDAPGAAMGVLILNGAAMGELTRDVLAGVARDFSQTLGCPRLWLGLGFTVRVKGEG